MMLGLETLFGTLLGGAFRMLPEVLRFFDRNNERKHELAMLQGNLEADKLRGAQAQALAETQTQASISVAEIQALIEGTKAQGQLSGIKWIDGFNMLIRPLLALQWLLLLWPAMIVVSFYLLYSTGTPAPDAFALVFGKEEKALASSIASFFLLDRSLRRKPF